MDLDQLDSELGGPMCVLVDGETYEIPAATELSWRVVRLCILNANYFMKLVWPPAARIKAWKIDVAHQRWCVHNGLTSPAQTQRLVYMVEKFSDGIEYDLRARFDISLGEMWRDRKWRELLGLIDQLPADSQKNRLLSQDEEYMERLLAQREDDGPGKPSMADWSQTNSMLATLIDAVNRNTMVTEASIPGRNGPKPTMQPFPRPATAAERVRRQMEKRAHEEMNAILLRDRPGRTG